MTSRERFRETMRYGTPDRVPYFEEGLRDDVLERWHEQGLPPDADLAAMFHVDARERMPVNIEPIPPMERPITTRADLDELRRRLDPADPRRLPDDWPARVAAWRSRQHVLELQLHRGFFLSMGVRDARTFDPVVYLLHDDPRLVHDILNLYGEFGARLAERILTEVGADCVVFSEPIGGNDRPLLSPETYGRFVLASYRPILDAARRGGVETLVYMTYANARPLLPGVVRAGFNCLWACEVNVAAMNYLAIRRRFGRDLRLIGGIDLDTLLQDKAAIRAEMERVIPPLLAQGGYVPLADGRVRANVPFEHYRYYRQVLEELTSSPGF
ncbi:MAG TPA: uroporphyrinogen decarboxylase family protein [Planctomycetota bacterium]|nr:uroporphyrinogen decarboxylase family protein [Planctomycetota bacterium]HRR80736.1 uroporphyrinogen decarboxylase family protein [Planctomycetota bacterium]HRT95541.1 uroporphyrinogen decarboxylase family protein [Planctomycetota bacterium]